MEIIFQLVTQPRDTYHGNTYGASICASHVYVKKLNCSFVLVHVEIHCNSLIPMPALLLLYFGSEGDRRIKGKHCKTHFCEVLKIPQKPYKDICNGQTNKFKK